jgi:predicted nucleic acid-binding protein
MTGDMKLVLDTDVLRSGLQSAAGASRLLLCGILEGAFVPLVTVATMLEAEEVLMRPESRSATGLSEEGTSAFLDGYLARSERVMVRRRVRPSATDPNDQIFVEALVNGGGDAIVTFNRRDYLDPDKRLASVGRTVVPILAPGEALRRLPWRPTAITRFAFPHH